MVLHDFTKKPKHNKYNWAEYISLICYVLEIFWCLKINLEVLCIEIINFVPQKTIVWLNLSVVVWWFCLINLIKLFDDLIVGRVVKWLEHQARNQHGLGSKPTCAILLCPLERHFMAHSPAWWSWQAVLNYSYIFIKLQVDSNILVSPEAGQGNCLPYVLAPPLLSCESGG